MKQKRKTLITLHSYANEQNVNNLNGTLLICITKKEILRIKGENVNYSPFLCK